MLAIKYPKAACKSRNIDSAQRGSYLPGFFSCYSSASCIECGEPSFAMICRRFLFSLLPFCLVGATALCAAEEKPADWGRVMFVGDSITHGINTPSYRWDFHKILADNGILYEEAGYTTGNYQRGRGNGVNLAPPAYRGVPFSNRHSAHEGGQIWQLFEPENTEYRQEASGIHYVTQSGVKYPGQTITALVKAHRAATYCVLLGTNDIIQNFHKGGSLGQGDNLPQAMRGILGATAQGKSFRFNGKGTLDTLADAMLAEKTTERVVVMGLIPPGRSKFTPADHAAVAEFNRALAAWAQQKGGVLYAPLGEGTVDVAAAPADPYGAVEGKNQRVDWIHPGPQTNLIMAGNLAAALGCQGRTLGLPRKNSFSPHGTKLRKITGGGSWDAPITPAADGSATLLAEGLQVGNGYGDGAWNTRDALSLTLDTGEHRGTLCISEAYITWGKDLILFSRDMSENTDTLRVVYTAGDAAQGVDAGFYVWLGTRLIGEACPAAPGSGKPGVSVSYSGKEGCRSGVLWAAPGSFAPAPESKKQRRTEKRKKS